MNTKRVLAAVALAGAALSLSGTAHAADPAPVAATGGIFGLGDSGGQNRDESLNQVVNVVGDSFMDGENNDFSPRSAVGGVDGLGSALGR
ncbi:hypothetical protein [Streptomyces sp. NPDC054958]